MYTVVESRDGDEMEPKDNKVHGGARLTLIGTVVIGCMGLASTVLLATTRNYLKPRGKKNILMLLCVSIVRKLTRRPSNNENRKNLIISNFSATLL